MIKKHTLYTCYTCTLQFDWLTQPIMCIVFRIGRRFGYKMHFGICCFL